MIAYPKRWTFRSYCSEKGDEIRGWYENQTPSVQAELTAVVLYLQRLGVNGWIESRWDYKELKGRLLSLSELRIVVGETGKKEHYRVLGFRDDSLREFTMLIADRKTAKFDFYARHGPTALRRKSDVESNRAKFSCVAKWMSLP